MDNVSKHCLHDVRGMGVMWGEDQAVDWLMDGREGSEQNWKEWWEVEELSQWVCRCGATQQDPIYSVHTRPSRSSSSSASRGMQSFWSLPNKRRSRRTLAVVGFGQLWRKVVRVWLFNCSRLEQTALLILFDYFNASIQVNGGHYPHYSQTSTSSCYGLALRLRVSTRDISME